ncbi:hypothetical protein QBC46DRAFT_13971 [Diplogelasinospora grovesii]|uniref:Uncharacterized protein n=1 Tax=Diplogelasinospora grovesii TaxID=303347 RepID=A0AAN6NHT1_9PEZI|nr:hypothetical protein QBC46DRAFT_13971 [Diplogelasinospora grovesii]
MSQSSRPQLSSSQQGLTDRNTPLEPSPGLLELYRKMRDAEEKRELQWGQNLSLPRPTAISRPPLFVDSTSPVARGPSNGGYGEQQVQSRRKGRPVRQGPLKEYTRARAAFLRKVGACRNCQERKVKCDHYNDRFSKLEAKYQEMKQQEVTPYQPRFGNPLDFHGLAQNPPMLPSQERQHTSNEVLMELDDLLCQTRHQQNPVSATQLSPLYNFSTQLPIANPAASPWAMTSAAQGSPQSVASTGTYASFHPMGRLLANSDGEWECLWSNYSPGSETQSGGALCNRRHRQATDLAAHVRHEHAPFQEEVYNMLHCVCGLAWHEPGPACPECGRTDREVWLYGSFSSTPSLYSMF